MRRELLAAAEAAGHPRRRTVPPRLPCAGTAVCIEFSFPAFRVTLLIYVQMKFSKRSSTQCLFGRSRAGSTLSAEPGNCLLVKRGCASSCRPLADLGRRSFWIAVGLNRGREDSPRKRRVKGGVPRQFVESSTG